MAKRHPSTSPCMRPNILRKVTGSVPLLITVAIHVVLIAIAGYFVTEQVISKKKVFEANSAPEESIAQKNVEHRLQIARKAGGSTSTSPVSATRIFSTAQDSLQLPTLPELPSVGQSSLAGIGFGAGMGSMGTGTGLNTGGVGTSGLGKGFMNMSFLGMTDQRARNVVFIIDISPALMDIRKGGFQAFAILRTQISQLVGNMPAGASFNVIFFEDRQVRLFAKELQPATVANKTQFFDWIKVINIDINTLGARSIPASSPRWTYNPPESLKLDPLYSPAEWIQSIHAALEQKADTIFLITGTSYAGNKKASPAEIAHYNQERDKQAKELKAQGLNLDEISAARAKAFNKVRTEVEAMNRTLIQQQKTPFVISNLRRLLDADMQAALKSAGYTITVETKGWTDKGGRLIWQDFNSPIYDRTNVPFSEVITHISRLQYGLVRERAALHLFLFEGLSDRQENDEKNLSALASKNGGKFTVLTTKRLEEMTTNTTNKK